MVSAPRAELLRLRDFRNLWLGQSLSAVGDPIFPFAVAFLAIERGESAGSVATLFAARALATTMVVLAGGVLADRFSRKRIMIGADLLRVAAIGAVVLFGTDLTIVAISGLVFVVGIGEALFRPAYSALIASLVPAEKLQSANALTALTRRTASFVGPALAGLLVTVGSPRAALLFAACTFLASVVSLVTVKEPAQGRELGARQSMLADAADGFRAVSQRRWVVLEIAAGLVQVTACLAPWLVLVPLVAAQGQSGAAAYTTLLLCMSAGAVIGAATSGRIRVNEPGTVASLALLPFSAALLGLALGWPLPVVAALHLAAGLGAEVYTVLWVTALQRAFPSHQLGRVFSIDQLGSLALLPLGMLLSGSVATPVGVGTVLVIAAVINVITSVLPLVFTDVRRFADLPSTSRASSDGEVKFRAPRG